MANSLVLKLTCLALMCMVIGAPVAQAAISCGQIQSSVTPCISYLRTGGAPSKACCNGIKSLSNAAKTTAGRQAACECLKTVAGSISGLNLANAASLPSKCGLNVHYNISTSTNCKNVK
ncbi:hypothetical protein ACB092_09G032600 [Castanea dentata]